MDAVRQDVTRLLGELESGNRDVLNELFRLVYEEMHRMAHFERHGWHGDQTMNTTALVHEAYLKLVDQTQLHWESRAHFLAVAARAMRHILIDYARLRRRQKRGGDIIKVSLEALQEAGATIEPLDEERAEVLILLDEALHQLLQHNERQCRVIECRFFGGMSIEETAVALHIAPATVKRDWAFAQAWLHQELCRAIESPVLDPQKKQGSSRPKQS